MSSNDTELRPAHLDPSELGTREYWDDHYANDINGDDVHGNNNIQDPSELESWFDDAGAPAKVIEYLTSKSFPLAPKTRSLPFGAEGTPAKFSSASVLDLGTGTGSMLFMLRLQARFYGYMVGVDYSGTSIELARKLRRDYSDPQNLKSLSEDYDAPPPESGADQIRFETFDVINDDAKSSDWWPEGGFDLVLDKGTFDAISLSCETATAGDGAEVRICELYPRKALAMVRPGGFLLVTSCNWTEDEVVRWFTTGDLEGETKVHEKIKYPTFEFGGKTGQEVATVCFRKI